MRIYVIAITAAVALTGCTFQALEVPNPQPPDGDDNSAGGDALCSGCGDPHAGDPNGGDTCIGSPCGDPTGGDTCNGPGCGDPTGGDTCNGPGCGDPTGGDSCPSYGCGDDNPGDPGPPPCPAQLPSSASDCWPPGLACEYGTDPRVECRDRAYCSGTGPWSVTLPDCGPLKTSADCKNSIGEMHGLACNTLGEVCLINEFLCECANCLPSDPVCGGNQVWACHDPQVATGCPPVVPSLGTACSPDALLCIYDCATRRSCDGGYWYNAGNNCPVSRREAKRDIEYLAPDQIDALAQQVLGIDLATYHYRDPRNGSGDKLGFIIDDQPNLPALTQGGQRVDLYAFSTMLLAALKVQAQQLELLQQQVEALHVRIDTPAAASAPVCAP